MIETKSRSTSPVGVMTIPDIILFMAASFSPRNGVSAGNSASVVEEQMVKGEIAAADPNPLRAPMRKPATATAATQVNTAGDEIDARERDIGMRPLKFQWSRFFQPVFGRRKSIDCSAELPPAVALSNSHYVARVNDAIPSAPP